MASEEEMSASEGEEEVEVVVGQMPTVMVPKHINKRSLKNKALSISFDEKALRDFVTGFHKRKKKRRKEAQKQLQEKDRLKRIAARKTRKQEREIAMYGRALSSDNPEGAGSENDDDVGGDHEGMEGDGGLSTSLSESKTYEDGSTRITVTTSEISREDDDLGPKSVIPVQMSYTKKNPSLAVKKNPRAGVKKKSSKRNFKNKSKTHKGSKKHGSSKDKRKNQGKKR